MTFTVRNVKNVKHHQHGKKPNYNQQLSLQLNFVNFQIRGAIGNIGNAFNRVDYKLLPYTDQVELTKLTSNALLLMRRLDELREEIAEFNKTKTCVD